MDCEPYRFVLLVGDAEWRFKGGDDIQQLFRLSSWTEYGRIGAVRVCGCH